MLPISNEIAFVGTSCQSWRRVNLLGDAVSMFPLTVSCDRGDGDNSGFTKLTQIRGEAAMDSAFDVSLVTEHSSIVLKQLSKPDHELREALLLKMRNEPASSPLQAYFEKLKKGSDIWDVETYIGFVNPSLCNLTV